MTFTRTYQAEVRVYANYVLKQIPDAKIVVLHPAMLIDGVNLDTGPSNYEPMRKPRMVRFDGERFTYFSEIINAGSG